MKKALIVATLAFGIIACSEEPKPVTLCEKPCVSDTLNFALTDNEFEPYVKLVPGNCFIDTVIWSHKKIENRRKIHLSTFIGEIPAVDKSTIKCYIRDTSYAFLVFNDCLTRRGYWMKLPYSSEISLEKSVSAINSADPRYSVEEGLLCYKANNTVYVQEIMTGKVAEVTVPSPTLDYETMYEIIDSVNITRNRIFMNLKDGGSVKPFEKTIELK